MKDWKLTRMPAGTKDDQGRFPPGTIHYLANQQLETWSSKRKMGSQKKSRSVSLVRASGLARKEEENETEDGSLGPALMLLVLEWM